MHTKSLPNYPLLYPLIVISEEHVALDLFVSLGVGGVSRWSSWYTEWHDSGALFVSTHLKTGEKRLTTQVSGKPRSSLTFPSALGSKER